MSQEAKTKTPLLLFGVHPSAFRMALMMTMSGRLGNWFPETLGLWSGVLGVGVGVGSGSGQRDRAPPAVNALPVFEDVRVGFQLNINSKKNEVRAACRCTEET